MFITESLVYGLFSWCLVYPPTEVVAAGFTIAKIFENFIGSEDVDFVFHHVRRTALTLFLHSLIPLGYVLFLMVNDWDPYSTYLGYGLATSSLALPLCALYFINEYYRDGWASHPLIKELKSYAQNSDVQLVINEINFEFKRVDKVCIPMNTVNKIIITDKWIIKTSIYKIFLCKQDEASLTVIGVDTLDFSLAESTHFHQKSKYINVTVNSGQNKKFNLRLNSLSFTEVQRKLRHPIINVPDIPMQNSLTDQFVSVFKNYVEENPKHMVNQQPSLCIGCMEASANVKLMKHCQDVADSLQCGNCQCRPLWCCDCMGRWFASRQDQERVDTWLSSKCTCPVCRTVFCMLDVSLTQVEN